MLPKNCPTKYVKHNLVINQLAFQKINYIALFVGLFSKTNFLYMNLKVTINYSEDFACMYV